MAMSKLNPNNCKPLPQSLTQKQRCTILRKYLENKSYRKIANEMDISPFPIYKYLSIFTNTNQLYSNVEQLSTKTKKRKHKKCKIDNNELARFILRKEIKDDPQCYLKEYSIMLQKTINFGIHPATLGKWMKNNSISCKKIIKIAIETDPTEKNLHDMIMKQLIQRKRQWVTGDECSLDERILNRLSGWSEMYI